MRNAGYFLVGYAGIPAKRKIFLAVGEALFLCTGVTGAWVSGLKINMSSKLFWLRCFGQAMHSC